MRSPHLHSVQTGAPTFFQPPAINLGRRPSSWQTTHSTRRKPMRFFHCRHDSDCGQPPSRGGRILRFGGHVLLTGRYGWRWNWTAAASASWPNIGASPWGPCCRARTGRKNACAPTWTRRIHKGSSRICGEGLVMAGLDPAIHVCPQAAHRKEGSRRRRMDARIKSEHDDFLTAAIVERVDA